MSDAIGFAQAEALLLGADFAECRPVWYSSNYVYLAMLCGPDGGQFAAVYKPRRGETPLWDFPEGTLYRREAAAYQLSQALGWGFVPPTVVRDGPQGVGSLQLFVEHDQSSHFFEQRADPELVPQLQRMAVFDFVANNADRKGGHCLLDGARRIWGIDHGLCFHAQYKMRTVIWDWAGDIIAEPWLTDVEALRCALLAGDAKVTALEGLLEPDERPALVQRCEQLLSSRKLPAPGPHRSYPWPLV
ncbi:MAG: SCO1664 family protein [Tepidiformaceae bacterium]